ncbi:MAG: hypothetical protein AB7V42_00395 [Thermoleophilia bacterium]
MGIQDEIRALLSSESAKHKRLIEYVVRQLHNHRDLDQVLEDPYVVNRLSPLERRALLEEPEVVEEAGGEALERLRAHMEELAARPG